MLGLRVSTGVLAVVLLIAASARVAADGLPAPARAEIEHLLAYLGNSGCDFYRNGSWHDPREARAHLRKKGEYLIDRSQVRSADEFIERAATESSMSREPYRVRCPGRPPAPSADWLRVELRRLRVPGSDRR